MFTTSIAAVTMMGMLSTGAFLPGPAWTSDYPVALRQAAEQSKPIVVFIADGSDGFAQVLKDGPMPSEASKVLKDKFVCLFVDTTTTDGKATAKAFALTEGLVISSRGGEKQALRHNGRLTVDSLNTYLTRYQDAPATVATTETNAPTQPAQVVVPASYGQPVVNPFYCPSCQTGRR